MEELKEDNHIVAESA
jgi:hypothetical protein